MSIAKRMALLILLYNKELQKAEQLCQETISQLQGIGPSFEVCEAKSDLARVLVVKGDRESVVKAGELVVEIAAMMDQIKSNPSREFEQLVVNIAEELAPFDVDRAAAVWRAALPLAKSSFARDRDAALRNDSNPPFLLTVVLNYAELLQSAGKQQEALALFSNTTSAVSDSGDDFTLMRLTQAWAALNWNQGQAEQAEQHFRVSLQFADAIRLRDLTTGAACAGEIMSEFGQFLSDQKRFEEAENMHRRSLPLLLESGQYARALGSASQLGPDAVETLIAAALRHPGAKTPQPSDALVLGELRLLAGSREAAEAAIRAAIERDDAMHSFQNSLGWCLLSRGKNKTAKHAFKKALEECQREDGTYDLETASPDHMTAAYFLDLVPEQQYVEHFAGDKRLACFPWFYIAQRREIEGKMPEAIKANERSVSLRADDDGHPTSALADWRLRKLKEDTTSGEK
jgi:tetratricopeptide (TPR) repeat protein